MYLKLSDNYVNIHNAKLNFRLKLVVGITLQIIYTQYIAKINTKV